MQLNNKMNFLDFAITTINNKFEFNIYKKLTQTYSIIPYNSNYVLTQKIAFFYSVFYRLKHILLNKYS